MVWLPHSAWRRCGRDGAGRSRVRVAASAWRMPSPSPPDFTPSTISPSYPSPKPFGCCWPRGDVGAPGWSRFAAAALLYLPWLLVAGPQLLDYVSYKVVQDNDTPLALLSYLGRHLSAFTIGHLEGPLAYLWPLTLILLIAPAIALILAARVPPTAAQTPSRNQRPAIVYLLISLAIPLAIGFIQQLQAPFIPDRFERVLLFAAPALWLLLAIGLDALARISVPAAVVSAALLLAAAIASLTYFYITPRYADRDYRPLIENVRRNAQPGDSIYTIFPWQTGYFWSYLPADFPAAVVPSPATDWGDTVQSSLDQMLGRGAVWFPEHLALGAILETAAEDYLGQNIHQLQNRWYGDETRLTAWVRENTNAVSIAMTPIAWQNGVTLAAAQIAPTAPTSDQHHLLLDLSWQGAVAIDPANLTYSLWLTDPQGLRWAQRDVNPFAHPWPPLAPDETDWTNQDRIAITLPVGTPPGDYDLWIALLDADLKPIPVVGPNASAAAKLIGITLPPSSETSAFFGAQIPADQTGDGIRFRGHSRDAESYLTGDDADIELFWQPTVPLAADLSVFVQLLDDRGEVVAGMEGPPVSWYPTSQWTPGAVTRSIQRMRIPATMAAGDYRLIAGLFDPQTAARIEWTGRDNLDLGRLKVDERPHSFVAPTPQHTFDLTLAGVHRLLGYDLAIDGNINLVLYWLPDGATDVRYSTFVHLLDGDGRIISQSDQEPGRGQHPTTSWLSGEFVTDAHTLTRPAGDPPGPFSLALGLYDPISGQRLPFIDESGNIVADHITIALDE